MAEGGESFVVYFHCLAGSEYHWYGVELPIEQREHAPFSVPITLPSKRISPVATLRSSSHGERGSWTVIGDDIYWLGGMKDVGNAGTGLALCRHLLRHNVKDHAADPSYWETVSPSMRIPRRFQLLAAVGNRKLCVVGGEDYYDYIRPCRDVSDCWRHCGEIYDLVDDTWTYLDPDYEPFSLCPDFEIQAAVEENNDGMSTQYVFFSWQDGSLMTLNLPSCRVEGPVECANLDIWEGPKVRPRLITHVRPAFTDGMLYWLNSDLHLSAYHIVDQIWLESPSLQSQFPSPMDYSEPIAVSMQKEGRLLVVLSTAPEQLAVASLTVTRSGLFLNASVDVVQPLTLDRLDTFLMLLDGKSIHGAYHLPPPDRIGRAVELGQTGPPDVVLYIHGVGACRLDSWYRVDLETKRDVDKSVSLRPCTRPSRPRPYKQLSAVALGHSEQHPRSWTVIGENIYWIGGYIFHNDNYISTGKHLLKHDMNHTDLKLWEIESAPKGFPDEMPFLPAFGTDKQYIVACTDQHCSYCCGIYDLDEKTWRYMTVDVDITIKQATLVEKDGLTDIVLYSLDTGSVYFLDVTSGKLNDHAAHPNFALLQHSEQKPPPGLPHDLVLRLQGVAKEVPAVFTNNTFYWFAPDLCLYGYDVKAEIWFQSPSLEDQLPSLETFPESRYILLGLGNGSFLVIVGNYPGELTVVSLTVDKRENNLSVSVDSVQPLYADDASFVPFDGKAMLYNSEVIGLEEKVLRLTSNELKLEKELEKSQAEMSSVKENIANMQSTIDALTEEVKLLQSKFLEAFASGKSVDPSWSMPTKIDVSTSIEDLCEDSIASSIINDSDFEKDN